MSSAPDTSPPLLPACPYPGLRPFRRDEDTLFFGRSTHVSHLLQHLGDHRFLAVLGASGSGKSSLVRAGLMPALQAGLAGEIGYEWCCVEFRPGDDPLQRLADVLAELDNSLDNPADAHDGHARLLDADREFHRTHLTRRQNPLEEFRNDSRLGPEVNLLLLVDQFEELFRFRDPLQAEAEEAEAGAAPPADGRPRLTRQERVDESEVFINLLLAALSHPRIYIVLTMRSEYLGDCAKFGGLTEAINQNHYLTPRLNREQMAEAIERPAAQRGVGVEPELLNRLLNDAGANSDQLPLLQHTLSRMWRRLAGGTTTLTLAQYLDKPIETIARCLDAHATAIYESLTAEQQRIAARLFRSLTERGRHRRDTRRICTLGEIVDLIAADRARSAAAPDTPSTHALLPSAPAPPRDEVRPEVLAVIEKYREAEAAMLMPEAGVPLSDESTLDITHESVIRQWSLLRTEWIAREAEAAEGYFEYSSQARARMLPADAAARTRKRFFLSWFSRMMLHQPRFIVGAKLRRQLQHAASAAREFTDHLDDFGLQTAIRWRDAGGVTQPFLENASWKEPPPAEAKAAAPPDDMPRSAVWALRYDKRAAQHFPLTLNYINESQVRRESERAERWMLLNVVKVLSVLSILGIIGVCWVLHSLSKATEANLAAKTDADRRVEQALTEKRAADVRVAEAIAEKTAAAAAATQAIALTQTAQTNTKEADAKADAAVLEQQKADAAIMEARTQQAVSDWGAGRMLNALAHLARTQTPGGDAPWQPALASELPPPVTFSHLITNSGPPLSMTLSPDGRWLAVRVEKGVDLVDTHTGQLAGPPLELANSFFARGDGICFVPGSDPGEWCLLHCSGGGFQLYQIPALALRAEAEPAWLKFLQAQEKHRWEAIILSGDGSRLAALGTEGEVALVAMSAPAAGFFWQPTQKAKAKPDFSSGCLIALDHQGRHLVLVTAGGEVLVVEAGTTAAQCRLLAKPFTPDRATGFPGAVQLAISPLTATASATKSRLRFTLTDGEGRILPLSLERAAATKQKAAAAELEYQLVVESPPENPPQAALNIAVQAGPVAGPALAANAPRTGPSYANQSVSQIRRTAATPGMEFPRSGLPLIWTGNDATLRCWWGHGWRAAEEQWPNFQLVEAHRGKVTGCTIAPDASWAATCGEDGVTRFWRIMSGAERRQSTEVQPAEWSMVRWQDKVPVAWGLDGNVLKSFVAGQSFQQRTLRTFPGLFDDAKISGVSGDGSTALVMSLSGLEVLGVAGLAQPQGRLPLELESAWQFSHSGRRMALLTKSGHIAVFDTASGARVPGFATPEALTFEKFWYGAEDSLVAATSEGALLVLQEAGAPAPLVEPEPEGRSGYGHVATAAAGNHILVLTQVPDSNAAKAIVEVFVREGAAWSKHAGAAREIERRTGYDGGEWHCSPDGAWIAWLDPEQRLRRLCLADGRECPVVQPFAGKPISFAINDDGELLAAAGREIHLWRVPPGDGAVAEPAKAEPVRLAPECDWRLAAFADFAESTTGLRQESTFVQAPHIDVTGTAGPLPGPPPAGPALWQAALASDRALANVRLAAPAGPIAPATLTSNPEFESLLHWLDAHKDEAALAPTALSRWEFLTELAGLPSTELLAEKNANLDAELARAVAEYPLLRGESARQVNANIAFGLAWKKDLAGARSHFADADLRALATAAITTNAMSEAPLMAGALEEPILNVLLLVLSGTGETWRGPYLAALEHFPTAPPPDRPGPPHSTDRWSKAAGPAAEAARRLLTQHDPERAALLQPLALQAGRLALLAGTGQKEVEVFLKIAAEAAPFAAGSEEMRALALALLGDSAGAAALLQPLLPTEAKPERQTRHQYAPEFFATVQLLEAKQLQRAGDAAKAVALQTTALAALRKSAAPGDNPYSGDRELFLKFFRATPEIWEHAREFRAPQSARPPGRMRR